jgi:tight adherence protein C
MSLQGMVALLGIKQIIFIQYLAGALVAGGFFLFTYSILKAIELQAAQANLGDLKDRQSGNKFIATLRAVYVPYLVPILKRYPRLDGLRVQARQKAVAAGLADEFANGDEVLAFRLLMSLGAPVLMLVAKLVMGEGADIPGIAFAASPAAVWFAFDFWMSGVAERRQRAILRSMPFIVDLLALSTEAGLDFMGAMQKVVDKAKPGPLVDEFSHLLRQLRIGVPRQEGLRELSRRIDLAQINSFVAILISADQMGASIGKILRQQSDQMRNERLVRAEKEGAKAQQKLMAPLMLFFLPAVLLTLASPFILGQNDQ